MTFLFGGHSRLFKLILAQDWDEAIFQLHQAPQQAKRWSRVEVRCSDTNRSHDTQFLPLHQACSLNPPAFIVETLIAAYPEATHETDEYFQRTPLHVACLRGASVEILQILLKANPGAAISRDVLGRCPLHYAVFSHSPAKVIQFLLYCCSASARVQDKKGWLPVHVAARFGASRDVFLMLRDAYPNCVSTKTFGGMTPHACAKRFDVCQEKGTVALLEKGNTVSHRFNMGKEQQPCESSPSRALTFFPYKKSKTRQATAA